MPPGLPHADARGPAAGRPAGGPFGEPAGLARALRYAKAHGGGTVAFASQSGASRMVRTGADVVAIGGFSPRESEVSVAWLAQAVRDGKIRWVLGESSGMRLPADTRVGAATAKAAVRRACRKLTLGTSGTLYDCSGRAAALGAAAP